VLWTSDIGGYKGGNATDPMYQELIVRWFQFGAFCPLFRLHGKRVGGPPADACGTTNGDNEVWSYGPTAEACISDVMRLRESLRPYITQLSAEAAATGMPLLRPMVLAYPADAGSAQPWAEGQFMFGPDWLVAPVTAYGAAEWSVYLPPLPAGDAWVYHFNASVVYPGGGTGRNVTVPTPLEEFPLFVRTGNATTGRALALAGRAPDSES
jgi:alpha-D-xyloside xylohydrolase